MAAQAEAIAEQDIADYIAGAQHFINDMNVTHTLLARAQTDIQKFEAPIATSEAHNS